MDGKLAVLFAVLSAYEGASNIDDTNYFTKKPLQHSHLSVAVGKAHIDDYYATNEVGLNYSFDYTYGPWRPVVSANVTANGGVWVGYGGEVTYDTDRFFLTSYFIPGLYYKGNDVDLGSVVEFKSGLAAGMKFDGNSTLSIGYDHRSNSDFGRINPGTESVYLRYSLPLE